MSGASSPGSCSRLCSNPATFPFLVACRAVPGAEAGIAFALPVPQPPDSVSIWFTARQAGLGSGDEAQEQPSVGGILEPAAQRPRPSRPDRYRSARDQAHAALRIHPGNDRPRPSDLSSRGYLAVRPFRNRAQGHQFPVALGEPEPRLADLAAAPGTDDQATRLLVVDR